MPAKNLITYIKDKTGITFKGTGTILLTGAVPPN